MTLDPFPVTILSYSPLKIEDIEDIEDGTLDTMMTQLGISRKFRLAPGWMFWERILVAPKLKCWTSLGSPKARPFKNPRRPSLRWTLDLQFVLWWSADGWKYTDFWSNLFVLDHIQPQIERNSSDISFKICCIWQSYLPKSALWKLRIKLLHSHPATNSLQTEIYANHISFS